MWGCSGFLGSGAGAHWLPDPPPGTIENSSKRKEFMRLIDYSVNWYLTSLCRRSVCTGPSGYSVGRDKPIFEDGDRGTGEGEEREPGAAAVCRDEIPVPQLQVHGAISV